MKEELREIKLPVDLETRPDGIPMSEIGRLRAQAHLARADSQAELVARAARGVMKLLRLLIVRPLKRACETLCMTRAQRRS
jgi:hypothetical protein